MVNDKVNGMVNVMVNHRAHSDVLLTLSPTESMLTASALNKIALDRPKVTYLAIPSKSLG